MPVNLENYKEISSLLKEQNVTLVAVSKTKPVEDILELYNLGQRDFGENYVQELLEKYQQLPKDIRWHFIGHLQSNKAKLIAPFVHLIQSVDSEKLLKEINKEAGKNNRVIHCLLEVYIAKEESKFGLDEKEINELVTRIFGTNFTNEESDRFFKNICIEGLMGMASFTDDKEIVRKEFSFLKSLFDKYSKLQTESYKLQTLSMGMSGDYKMAIEGAFSTKNLLVNVGPVTGDILLYQDNQAGVVHQACAPPFNDVFGKVALIDRGDCGFTIKVKNAQDAGAIAVIVVNNDKANPGAVIPMGGTDNTITIPAVMVSWNDGIAIKAQLSNNVVVNVTLANTAVNDLDGDLDNGIVAHEYGHGVSSRLTGGPAQSACLVNKEVGGEGWSDYFALMVTTDWSATTKNDGVKPRPLGTYVVGEDPVTGAGIRRYPYSTDMKINPWTYAGVQTSGGEVHDIGEIWAATLWDMTWDLIQIEGINPDLYNADGKGGNSISMKLVMLGLKLQACRPGFIDARDGILKADQMLYNGKYSCVIWSAFARRGMGVKAQQGSSNSTSDQVQNFDIPSAAIIHKSADLVEVAQNGELNYTLTVQTQCASIANYKVVDTLPKNVTYVSGGTYNAANRTVSFDIPSLNASTTAAYTFKVKVNNNTYFLKDSIYNETVPDNSIPASLVATSNTQDVWTVSTTHHSAGYSLKSAGPATPSEQILTSASSYEVKSHSELSFWQSYDTELSGDGGVVELSYDNGKTWIDAGEFMSINGYNSTVNTNTNLENKPAYSGSSNGWIQTTINLSSFAGKNIIFRFRFVTDDGTTSGGWYIDDILIVRKPAVYNIARLYNGSTMASLSDTVTAINNSVTPVTWRTFTAEKSGNAAILKWSTSQESNTDQFIIERSGDGIHFNEIGVRNAAGNSNSISNYSTIDDSPLPGVNIYRIKQTDLDGNFTYSAIKSLTFDFSSGLISVSPNPSKGGIITLKIAGNNGNVKVALLNTTGQVLSRFTVNKDKNDLLLPALASGVYYLKITGDNISTVQKIVIEK